MWCYFEFTTSFGTGSCSFFSHLFHPQRRIDVMGKYVSDMTKEWEVTEERREEVKDKKNFFFGPHEKFILFCVSTSQNNPWTSQKYSFLSSKLVIFSSIVSITFENVWVIMLKMETIFYVFQPKKKCGNSPFQKTIKPRERALYKVIHHHPYPNGFKHIFLFQTSQNKNSTLCFSSKS